MIVVDASVALAWILEPDNADADAVLTEVARSSAIAPGNFSSEVVHVLLVRERRGEISRLGVSRALEYIRSLHVEAVLPPLNVVADVGRQYRLTGYDAAYLALAIEQGLPLATLDKALGAAARSEHLLWTASARKRKQSRVLEPNKRR